MKLSPVFPGSVKPVRVGVYQRKYRAGWERCYWTGRRWDFVKGSKSMYQDLSWRGLAKPGGPTA